MIMEKVEEEENDITKPFRMQVANLGYDNFLGRLAIGRVSDGKVKVGQEVFITSNE